MLKLGIQLDEVDTSLNIKLIDPTKKQLEAATENEKFIADMIKKVLDKKLLDMIDECEKEEKETKK